MDPGVLTGRFSELSALALPVRAHVKEQDHSGQTLYEVYTEWTQTELVRGSRLAFCQRWSLIIEEKHRIQCLHPPGPAVPLATECLSSFSPIQGLRAVIKEMSGHFLLEVTEL
uniref:Uncharacterized protein n=1 Tax=Knipowitschia caucasica TaxID=637954 RepID=A0AAV2LY01_KNICA